MSPPRIVQTRAAKSNWTRYLEEVHGCVFLVMYGTKVVLRTGLLASVMLVSTRSLHSLAIPRLRPRKVTMVSVKHGSQGESRRASQDTGSPESLDPKLGPKPDSKILLTIAGFDPSSGAGFTADLKVFAAHRLYGVAAATALTVQSTAGVRCVQPVEASLLADTLACLAQDLPLAGIKIGMLATSTNVAAVAEFLTEFRAASAQQRRPIVLDPVIRSSSGHALLDDGGLACLKERLLPLVTGVTPNLDELLLLAGRAYLSRSEAKSSRSAVEEAAALLARQYPDLAIVATGGHLSAPDDYVLAPASCGLVPEWLPGEWVDTPATHGTGCAFASSLLCGLVRDLPWHEAARAAKRYVTEALRAAVPIGSGGGAMDHFYASGLGARAVR